MSKPFIIYIDDDQKDARRVSLKLDKYFQVKSILPLEDQENLIETILLLRPDAVVVDFRLSELDPFIHYDGNQVLQEILKRKESFPVFLLTSHQDDAFVEVDDVNVVYEKGELFKSDTTFPIRIANQIVKYKKKIEEGENRLLVLLKKSQQASLTLAEEKEIIRLDGIIERSLEKTGAVPDELKFVSNESKVGSILDEVDELIRKVNKALPNTNDDIQIS